MGCKKRISNAVNKKSVNKENHDKNIENREYDKQI